MYISYFDETGDDGYPKYSSILFVLTSVYMYYQEWKENYRKIIEFRRKLKEDFQIPVKYEIHTKDFLLNKNPYRELELSDAVRKEIISLYFDLISILELKIINVIIDKGNIVDKYNVLENAFTYNIQRIENDLRSISPEHKFLIISDEGRIGKLTKTSRRIQRINPIPSRFHQGTYRKEIQNLIEDPLPKESKESYFIQVADAVSFIIYLYSLKKYRNAPWGNRIGNILHFNDTVDLLNKVKDRLNLKASSKEEYGIVYYPQKKNTT